MRDTQPKRNFTKVRLSDQPPYGNELRRSYVPDITENSPIIPKPLTYSDVDLAIKEFAENEFGLTVNGKDVPTFTLYSNQRFSEYSQTWKHTDAEGNLILNFKTINRTNDSYEGKNQGGKWNIPGDRWYKIFERPVLQDNGTEAWEIYSMKQPYAVDLKYRISFMTDLFENISIFNEMVNETFKAHQCYIRPNNHYIPLTLEGITDDSKYSVSDYRFYTLTINIKASCYIIHEEDFKVEKFPKLVRVGLTGDKIKKKACVDIEEKEEGKNQTIRLTVDFLKTSEIGASVTIADFTIDTDMDVQNVEFNNIINMRISVNGTPTYWKQGFKLKNGDKVHIKITPIDIRENAYATFTGINPSYKYNENSFEEDLSQDIPTHQEIEVI